MNVLSKIAWATLKMVMFFLFLLSMIAQVTVTICMTVIRVLFLLLLSSKHLREYELKKCYIQNKPCRVQVAKSNGTKAKLM